MEEEKAITIVKSEKQERALELMLMGQTDTQIAKALGITRQTLYNWRNLDARFMQALTERRSILRDQMREQLLELSQDAIKAVKAALACKDERVQLQAAKMVLSMLKVDREDALEESSLLNLLGQAIKGIEGEMGLKEKII
jgi:transposase-like protein